MQTVQEIAITANLLSAVVSAIVVAFLLRLWYRQENRMFTDLPLMFGITFISMTINASMQALTIGGILPDTIDVFRVRALVISGSAFPLLGALLHIWLPRFRKYHIRIMFLLIVYWVAVALLGPTESFVMTLLIPLLLVFTVGMIATFTITWKTGRLKEVRSDLLVISFLMGFVSQALRVSLTAVGLEFISIIIAALSAVVAGIALANPWFYQAQSRDRSKETSEIVETAIGV